jgi:septin family protein
MLNKGGGGGGVFATATNSGNNNNGSMNFTKIMGPAKEKTQQPSSAMFQQRTAERPVDLKGYVGFDKLANQFVAKCVRDGFAFNILCIGETGIGKSTLIETLFNANFNLKPSGHAGDRVQLSSNTFELSENNINLKLTIIETSGYGDQIDKGASHEEIVAYVSAQCEAYLQEELSLRRSSCRQINDTRVHACLYFITPTGHSLKALDLSTMKVLDRRVNIIPVIGKADTICKNELAEFKRRIMSELSAHGVSIYQFPINENDLNVNNLNASVNVCEASVFLLLLLLLINILTHQKNKRPCFHWLLLVVQIMLKLEVN